MAGPNGGKAGAAVRMHLYGSQHVCVFGSQSLLNPTQLSSHDDDSFFLEPMPLTFNTAKIPHFTRVINGLK